MQARPPILGGVLSGARALILKNAWLDRIYDDKAMTAFRKDAPVVVD